MKNYVRNCLKTLSPLRKTRPILVATMATGLFLSGCASTLPMDGGRSDDHATTVAKCGVGNYTFHYLKEPCQPERSPVVSDYEYSDEDTIGMSESSALFLGDHLDLTQEVMFKPGSATIDTGSKENLNDVAWMIRSNEDRISRVTVEGHSDANGSAERNVALSQARARAVREYLIGRGVDGEILRTQAFGESMPKYNESTSSKAELARNRRVEFHVETYEE